MNPVYRSLLLASSSRSRKMLLREARIPFIVIKQIADESACDWTMPLPKLVESIALSKMHHAQVPEGHQGDICFVLTADTLSQDQSGEIQGKPVDRHDAIKKIRSARNGSTLCTAFCLDRKQYDNGQWITQERILRTVQSQYRFIVPDHLIERYLQEHKVSMEASNAIAVEGYGSQFLEVVHGSYTAIVGLPLFEVRQALETIGFSL